MNRVANYTMIKVQHEEVLFLSTHLILNFIGVAFVVVNELNRGFHS